MRRTLLLVWHSRTGHAEQMAAAIERGAISAAAEMGSELAVVSRRAADASTADVLSASGYAFCAPENLASTSGAMLEFFHRTYYDAFDDEEARLAEWASADQVEHPAAKGARRRDPRPLPRAGRAGGRDDCAERRRLEKF